MGYEADFSFSQPYQFYRFGASSEAIEAGSPDQELSGVCAICTSSSNSSNFNGTPIPSGDYIWFNANFTASGIPSSGATITLTNSAISFRGSQRPDHVFKRHLRNH